MPIRAVGSRAGQSRDVHAPPRHRAPANAPGETDAEPIDSGNTSQGTRGQGANWTEDGDYIVGKGRPPVATRWKPGQSGNPKGKAKGSRDLDTLVLELMDRNITLATGKGEETMSRLEALIRKLFEQAVKGDHKAATLLLERYRSAVESRTRDASAGDGLSAAEQAMLDTLLIAYQASRSYPSEPTAEAGQ